jgi:hypothetical protein
VRCQTSYDICDSWRDRHSAQGTGAEPAARTACLRLPRPFECSGGVRTSRAAIPPEIIRLHSRAVHPIEVRVSFREDPSAPVLPKSAIRSSQAFPAGKLMDRQDWNRDRCAERC